MISEHDPAARWVRGGYIHKATVSEAGKEAQSTVKLLSRNTQCRKNQEIGFLEKETLRWLVSLIL